MTGAKGDTLAMEGETWSVERDTDKMLGCGRDGGPDVGCRTGDGSNVGVCERWWGEENVTIKILGCGRD